MFSDLVGYTAIAQRSEERAMRLLEEYRKILRPIFLKHNGREIKTIGDAFLVEFSSAVEAVKCAVEIQEAVKRRNEEIPELGSFMVRIGLHIGEIMEEEGDVYGDAVNIASRIHSFAELGGICLSGQVYEAVSNKLNFEIESIGKHNLKNVLRPVEIYQIASNSTKANHSLMLPRNRIAILPFVNISPDRSDEYFADGLTEELISKLSRVKGLRVIARTSVMQYRGREKRISEIGKELNVGTIVEGGVRKAGDKIRVTVQVIDTNTEEHLWSESYDRKLDDIFSVQTEIALKITESLPERVAFVDSLRHMEDTKNITAYTLFLQAKELAHQREEYALRRALDLLKQCIYLDSTFARAYVALADCYSYLGVRNFMDRDDAVNNAKVALEKAIKINPNLSEAHSQLALIAWFEDDFRAMEREAMKAIELNPSSSDAYFMLSLSKATDGYLREAIKLIEIAYRLDPLSPRVIGYLGLFYLYSEQEDKAIDFWNRTLDLNPFENYRNMAEYYMSKGMYDLAENMVQAMERLSPADIVAVAFRGVLYALEGKVREAEDTIKRMKEQFKEGATVVCYEGLIRLLLGDIDGYFDCLFRAVEKHVLLVFQVRYSKLYERGRSDPRYREVLTKSRVDPELHD